MVSFSYYLRKKASGLFIFGNLRRPINPFKTTLLYWKEKGGIDNVGDLLSVIVVENTIEYLGINRQFKLYPRKLCAIGSVLSFIGSGKTTVWGTGLMTSDAVSALLDKTKNVVLDIRALRGPLTRHVLEEHTITPPHLKIAYGDPAVLMPLFYKPDTIKQKGKVTIIPHHSRVDKYREKFPNVVDTYTSDWKGFINEIASSEKVISSSLHGIILAEAYGIPAVMLNDYPGTIFKYMDYYMSTGRKTFPIANSIEEAFAINGEINPILEQMQQELLDSFPKDIF